MRNTIVVLISLLSFVAATPGCVARAYSAGTVCVCNRTYCDDIEPLQASITPGMAVVYRTSLSGNRMDKSTVQQQSFPTGQRIVLDTTTLFQQIIGFGGAFTDATGINLNSLSSGAQQLLIHQYFGPSGTEYTLGRVPIASTDFSLSPYSYDDVDGDFNLTNFSLSKADFMYKIPYIKQAMALQQESGGLRLFAAPWSAPGWMKMSGQMRGGAPLRGAQNGAYYQKWASYFVRFFEAYLAEGIPFWAVTPQNEPTTSAIPLWPWQTMYFDAVSETNFVKDNLSPALKSSNASNNLLIMGLDDQRWNLPTWADVMLADNATASLIAGIAVHWYADQLTPTNLLTATHNNHPDKFILNTEACTGFLPIIGGPSIGSYSNGEAYTNSIIQDLNNWVGGWVDWNMALNPQISWYILQHNGGPSWASNTVDSPIIVNATNDEFLKESMYYMMAHFSKFLKPGSQIAKLTLPLLSPVQAVGAVMVDGRRYISVLNQNHLTDVTISIQEKGVASVYTPVTVPKRSIATIIWGTSQ